MPERSSSWGTPRVLLRKLPSPEFAEHLRPFAGALALLDDELVADEPPCEAATIARGSRWWWRVAYTQHEVMLKVRVL